MVAGGAATVVVGPRSRGFGEHGERPPVAGIVEAFVADLASLDVVRAAGRDRDRRGAGIGAKAAGVGESGWVVADFGEHAGGQDRSQAGRGPQDRGLWVSVELPGEFGFEVL